MKFLYLKLQSLIAEEHKYTKPSFLAGISDNVKPDADPTAEKITEDKKEQQIG